MTTTNEIQPREPTSTEQNIIVTAVAGRDDVERFETNIRLPAAFQYTIPARKKVRGQWVDDNKVGISSDGYDYLNRTMGVTFFLPDNVPDTDGTMVSNPIHRPDYIYCRMGATWYNEVGQLVSATEDLEVDFNYGYQNARLEAYESEVVLDDTTKQPVFDAKGHPLIRLKNADDEKKALKALMQLRTMGMRYAQTVLRTRLLKVAIGIKSLPGQQPEARDIRIVGYRDRMTPRERVASATDGLAELYGGRPAEMLPLSDADLAAIEPGDADAVVAAVVETATGTATEPSVLPPDEEVVQNQSISPEEAAEILNAEREFMGDRDPVKEAAAAYMNRER